MQESAKKRQRSENWLEEDKLILKELVRERVHLIENKNTDMNTNSMKVAAWKDLRESFNCMCTGAPRTVAQLKAQWGLIKIKIKKTKAAEKRELFKTVGGPPPTIVVSSEDVSSWLPNEFVTDTNEFDSDQINQDKIYSKPSTSTSEDIVEEVVAVPSPSCLPPNPSLPEYIKEVVAVPSPCPPPNPSLPEYINKSS